MSRTSNITMISAVIFSLASVFTGPATADVHNPNISISKSELKAKCARSGGDWKVERNGVYRCVVHNDDSTTVVECEGSDCDGFIFDNERIIVRKKRWQPQIVAPNNLFQTRRFN